MNVDPDELADIVARRRSAAQAGHRGDESVARSLLHDPAPTVRATALAALGRMGCATVVDFAAGVDDPHPAVRRRAAVEARLTSVDLVPLLSDEEPLVVEAAAWALGERGTDANEGEIAALVTTASGHGDPLCREAAVAALGAIGAFGGLSAILAATGDKPAVRRRAVLALAAFEGPEVDEALRRALGDRDWQVRQAAEDLLADERPA